MIEAVVTGRKQLTRAVRDAKTLLEKGLEETIK
jgi:hypothetical protein